MVVRVGLIIAGLGDVDNRDHLLIWALHQPRLRYSLKLQG